MNKFLASGLVAFTLFSAPLALAQSYYGAGCGSILAGLSVGARSSSVTALQNLLVAQNYPGGGSWMITGYFGAATAAALRNFQATHGLPQTGMTDAATAAALSGVSCGSNVVAPTNYYPTTYPVSYPSIPAAYPSYNSYSSYPSYYGGTTAITSLSQNTGAAGQSVTIFGVGFDPSNNTLTFGSTVLSNVPSQNGTSLTVVVPSTYYSYSYAGTPVQITVQNSHGTSNPVSFTVIGNPYNGCGVYNSIPCTNCPFSSYNTSNNYNGCVPQNTVNPVVSYLSPTSGAVGTLITVYGTGFSTTGNVVHFGTGIIANLGSSDGRAVSFTVPAQLTGYGSQPVTLSSYQVSVTNNVGVTSNAVPFAVTSLLSGGAPSITSVNGPTNLAVGVQGTWTVLVNTQNNQYLILSANWGDQNVYGAAPTNQQLYGNGQQTNTLAHSYASAGTYTIAFTISNGSGQQNVYTTTVVVGNNTANNVTMYSITPSSAPVGTQVVIQGQGFSQYDNTVHFGNGGLMHVPSQNGTTIYYTIPSYLSPCDVQVSGSVCAMYAQQVSRGSYPVYVTNTQGTSNTLNFNVQ